MNWALAKRKVALTNEIYSLVKEQIITMQLLPGQLLLVQGIADDIGISRTPVREALVCLRDEGLLEDADGHKFRVTQITWKLIRDLYAAREAVEPFAAAETAAKITKQQISALNKLLTEMECCNARGDFHTAFVCDMAFHDKIIEILDNHIILGWMRRIHDHQRRIRYLSVGSESRMECSLREHREILERLKQHDGPGVSAAMRSHLERSRQNMMELRNQTHFVAGMVIKDI